MEIMMDLDSIFFLRECEANAQLDSLLKWQRVGVMLCCSLQLDRSVWCAQPNLYTKIGLHISPSKIFSNHYIYFEIHYEYNQIVNCLGNVRAREAMS
jgi:hypothetical protein